MYMYRAFNKIKMSVVTFLFYLSMKIGHRENSRHRQRIGALCDKFQTDGIKINYTYKVVILNPIQVILKLIVSKL